MFWFKGFVLTYILFLLFLAIFYGIQTYRSQIKNKPEKNLIRINKLTVIIPFRNEYANLKRMLLQITELTETPFKFLFVNDHSEDHSLNLFNGLDHEKIEVISIDNLHAGKKWAIYKGVSHATTENILCWDADVLFSNNYFQRLSQCETADLIILPVYFKSSNLFQCFGEIDVYLANYTNRISTFLFRPILCSGANLFFRKDSYLQVIDMKSHAHISSGDDDFLLRNMQKSGKRITLAQEQTCAVHTASPASPITFIKQRSRWLGKAFQLDDWHLNTWAILQFFFTIGFLLLFLFFIIKSPALFVIVWTIKSVSEIILLAPYFIRIKRIKSLSILPVYGLLFPFYNIVLILTLFMNNEWKGRPI